MGSLRAVPLLRHMLQYSSRTNWPLYMYAVISLYVLFTWYELVLASVTYFHIPNSLLSTNENTAFYFITVFVLCTGWLSRYSDWLRAGRSEIESQWGRDFAPIQTGPGAHPTPCTMGTESFPGVKCGRGVLLTTHPLLAPRSWKSRAIPLPTFWATSGL